ncbi:MAG: metallophosphoesterase [Cytophagaceae bacterium]
MQISSWEYFLISLAVLSVIIAWYVLSRKKPKKPWYVHTERNWRAKSPSSDHEIIFSAFLIGDAGANTTKNPEPTMVILKQKLKMAQEKSAVFFLGDNIYPKGLPEPDNAFYAKAADHLMSQLQVCEEYKGRVCFISGNHDWNKGRRGGLKAVLRQQDFVDNFFGRDDFYLPRNGCPGPVVVPLYENLCAIVINTQWWVHKGKKPIGAKDGCTVQSEEDFFSTLEQVLDENKNKHLLVIGHHPMYSKAFHGGKFDVKQHLFPLTELHKKMYVPLPLAGSLYPIYIKYFG